MKWTPENYEKLYDAVELKILSLSTDQVKSDLKRHKLYAKDTNTQEESEKI
jgi:hypothetical protein